MRGVFEADVTEARRWIREEGERTGERPSFTAFLIGCLARAVDEDRGVQGSRRGRRLVVFEDVDVATLVEVETGTTRVPLFHVVRDAARKTLREIHDEIRGAQAARAGLEARRRQIRRVRWVPRPVRALLWRALVRPPRTWKRCGGALGLTSVGMVGSVDPSPDGRCATAGGVVGESP